MKTSARTTAQPPPNPAPPSALRDFLDKLPLIQWVVGMILACAMAYFTLTLSQQALAGQITALQNEQKATRDYVVEKKNESDKRFDDLQKNMLTRDEFNARWEQIDRIYNMLERQQEVNSQLLRIQQSSK